MFRPKLGWRLFFRRIGVKLGWVTTPLIPDYAKHEAETAYFHRALALLIWLQGVERPPPCVQGLIATLRSYIDRALLADDDEPNVEERLLLDSLILTPTPGTAVGEWLSGLGVGHLLSPTYLEKGNVDINNARAFALVAHYLNDQ